MLVFSRKPDQSVKIGSDITVTVTRVLGRRVWLGFEAPRDVAIVRDDAHYQGEPAQPVDLPGQMAAVAEELEALNCMACLDTGTLPTVGNGSRPCPDCAPPSITAATSAALVEAYQEEAAVIDVTHTEAAAAMVFAVQKFAAEECPASIHGQRVFFGTLQSRSDRVKVALGQVFIRRELEVIAALAAEMVDGEFRSEDEIEENQEATP